MCICVSKLAWISCWELHCVCMVFTHYLLVIQAYLMNDCKPSGIVLLSEIVVEKMQKHWTIWEQNLFIDGLMIWKHSSYMIVSV